MVKLKSRRARTKLCAERPVISVVDIIGGRTSRGLRHTRAVNTYSHQKRVTDVTAAGDAAGAVMGDGGVGDNVYVPEMSAGELGELGGV